MHVSGVYNQSRYIMNTLLLLCQRHQLPPVIDASLITPVTHVNQGSMLLKLIGWRHCLYFKWVPYIPGTTAQTTGVEPSPTARKSGNMYNKSGNMYSMYITGT